jgi:hypothetical protein
MKHEKNTSTYSSHDSQFWLEATPIDRLDRNAYDINMRFNSGL